MRSTLSSPYFLIETCSECGGSAKVVACIEDPVLIKKILAHLKEKGVYQARFGYSRVAARHKRAYLTKETPFANHKAEVRSTWPIRPLRQMKLTTFGREMAGLLRGGQGGFPVKKGGLYFLTSLVIVRNHILGIDLDPTKKEQMGGK